MGSPLWEVCMESQELGQFLAEHHDPMLSQNIGLRPWYNPTGDCIEYHTQHDAIVADRIDEYLTIYRSVDEKRNFVGFQLKDIAAIMKLVDHNTIQLEITTDDNKTILSVTALLFTLIENNVPLSIKKRQGYYEAMNNIQDKDSALCAYN